MIVSSRITWRELENSLKVASSCLRATLSIRNHSAQKLGIRFAGIFGQHIPQLLSSLLKFPCVQIGQTQIDSNHQGLRIRLQRCFEAIDCGCELKSLQSLYGLLIPGADRRFCGKEPTARKKKCDYKSRSYLLPPQPFARLTCVELLPPCWVI